MTFARLWILHFLWLVPLAALALIVETRKKKRTLEQFADPLLLARLTGAPQKGRRFIKGLLLLTSLAFLLLALAGPRWGSHYQEVSQRGVDIMVLVDVSTSMLVEDVKPNRLERAGREVLDFIKVIQGDRIGLVAFSGVAFVQCPLTLDYQAVGLFLRELDPDLIPVPGTDLGAAIEAAVSAFDEKTETDKVIVLITDGEDNENRGLEAARKAAGKGIRVFVFGMGEASGGPIPSAEGRGGFKKDKQGKMILSRLDEKGLRDIAATTGGSYARAVAGDLDLDILYFDGIKSRTEAKTLKSGKIKVYEERFFIFVLAAILLLLLEGLVTERKPIEWIFSPLLLLILVPAIFQARPAGAAEDPEALYRGGRFAEAEKAYAELDMDHPRDVRYRYNRGCAAYRNSDYQGARSAFSSVLRRSEDKGARLKAAYNLGNTAFKQGDFKSAAEYYRLAVLSDPSHADAKYNLELALRALEKQKKEQEKTQSPQDQGEGREKGEKSGDEASKKPESKKPKAQKEDRDRQRGDSEREEGKEPQERQKGGANEKGSAEQESPEDLSGELKPLRDPATQGEGGEDKKAAETLSGIDRKKAEALLDNIKEDRSRYLRFLVPEDKRYGVVSGKDW